MPTPEEVAEAFRLLGFDPDQTKAVIVTTEGAVAIAADYPEPARKPEEDTNGE